MPNWLRNKKKKHYEFKIQLLCKEVDQVQDPWSVAYLNQWVNTSAAKHLLQNQERGFQCSHNLTLAMMTMMMKKMEKLRKKQSAEKKRKRRKDKKERKTNTVEPTRMKMQQMYKLSTVKILVSNSKIQFIINILQML